MFKLVSKTKLFSVDEVRCAGDGCRCVATITHCVPDQVFPLDTCSLCIKAASPLHRCVIVGKNSTFELCLGQLPDLTPRVAARTKMHYPNGRSLLEHVLCGCKPREELKLVIDFSNPSSVQNIVFEMTLRIDDVIHPPVCVPRPPVHSELQTNSLSQEGGPDLLENSTNDWNPELAIYWAVRAWDLKERGTWLVKNHPRNIDSENCRSEVDDLEKAPDSVWGAAFVCYKRALQLAILAKWAFQTCAASDLPVDNCDKDFLRSPWFNALTPDFRTIPHSSETKNRRTEKTLALDVDHYEDISPPNFDVSPPAIERLEFELLLNIALCQIKAGSKESAVQNCSHALLLDPGWIPLIDKMEQDNGSRLLPDKIETDSWMLSNLDVAKVLYRRGQAFIGMKSWDEAESDLEMTLKLQQYPHGDGVGTGVSATNILLAQVRKNLSDERDLLVQRLRKRRNLL